MDQKWNVRPLAAAWCAAMAEAGFDDQAAGQVLQAVAASPPEAEPDREQFYRTLAHQSREWYRATIEGRELTPEILLKIVEHFEAQEEG